jgi:hypothetical protein
MASITESAEGAADARTRRTIGVIRLAATGAITAGVFFALCWVGLFLPFGSPTHAYLGLFTNAEMTSAAALIQGLCWSVAFGALVGGLTAFFYNALSVLD